jgi:cytidyltransferase-like protein
MTHYYHLTTLQRCKRLCDILIVAVDSDRLVKETKGSTRPVFVEDHRVALIDGYKPVDFALVMDSLGDFKKVASWIKPDFMFKNDEFVGREEEIVGLKESGAKLIIIPDADVVSSTSAFVEKIKKEGL